MPPAKFKEVHPVLPVRDVEKALAYYVDRLGFRLIFRDSSDATRYVGVRRDAVEIHLQWHEEADFRDTEKDGLMLRLFVDDPDALFAEYKDKEVFHDRTDIADKPWGTREFAFYDLNGHGLTFYRDL